MPTINARNEGNEPIQVLRNHDIPLRDRMQGAGLPGRNIQKPEGREQAAADIADKSQEVVSSLSGPQLNKMPEKTIETQLKYSGRRILHEVGQLKIRSRVQMGLSGTVQGVNFILPGSGIIGSAASHVLGWSETKTKQRLVDEIDNFCNLAKYQGIDTGEKLQQAKDRLGNPLSKGRLGLRLRSLFTTLVTPLARTGHRLVQEGKYNEVTFEVKEIMEKAGIPLTQAV